MEKPLVSVIMGVYNQWDRQALNDAVSSILNQTYRNIEFIIWDDGSDPEAARALLELPEADERIILAGREENKGLAFSLNECIRLAKGKYIARMDSDDISLPKRLEKQVDFLEKHPEYGWCGTAAELFDEDGVWGVRSMPKIPVPSDFYRYSPYIHPSVMFRAEIFDSESRYLETEETLRCEDYEIFMNLTQRGLKGYNMQDILFQYRETGGSYQRRKFRFRLNESKTRYRNYKKMGMIFPLGWLYVMRPMIAGLLPVSVIKLVKRREGENEIRHLKGQMDGNDRKLQGSYPVLQKYHKGTSAVRYGTERVS